MSAHLSKQLGNKYCLRFSFQEVVSFIQFSQWLLYVKVPIYGVTIHVRISEESIFVTDGHICECIWLCSLEREMNTLLRSVFDVSLTLMN